MEKTESAVRQLDDDLWVIDHPFKMPGGIALGTRTTIVRLSQRGTAGAQRDTPAARAGLWVHSPGPLTPEISEWFEKNGPVEAIVAPNLLHHLFLADTATAFPDATVYGPEGLAQKTGSGLDPKRIEPVDHPWKDDFDCMLVEGCPKMNETVYLHRATRTLILTDLAFNFESADSLFLRLFLRINGALGKFGPSRLAKSYFFGDHAAVGRSVARILKWDFDRVVLSHGEVLETGGPAALRSAYEWVLSESA